MTFYAMEWRGIQRARAQTRHCRPSTASLQSGSAQTCLSKLLGLVAIASVVGSRTGAGMAVNYRALLVCYDKKGSTSWDSCDDLGTDFDAAPGASHLQFR